MSQLIFFCNIIKRSYNFMLKVLVSALYEVNHCSHPLQYNLSIYSYCSIPQRTPHAGNLSQIDHVSLASPARQRYRIHTIVLEARCFSCKPQSLVHRRAKIILMRRNERRRDIRVRTSEKRVAVPTREEKVCGRWDGGIWEHKFQDLQALFLHL